MRRVRLAALIAVVAMTCLVSVATGAARVGPAIFKTGTYKAKIGTTKFNITLKRAKCGGASKLCVVLPVTPVIQCPGPAISSGGVEANFATAVALPASGKLTERVPASASNPGLPPATGQTTFSVAFTRKGAASGYFELNLTADVGGTSLPCTSGKVRFTAKLN
jgi:hypothetical protein